LAPTVGIAATGFCYPGGILQVFIDKISKFRGCQGQQSDRFKQNLSSTSTIIYIVKIFKASPSGIIEFIEISGPRDKSRKSIGRQHRFAVWSDPSKTFIRVSDSSDLQERDLKFTMETDPSNHLCEAARKISRRDYYRTEAAVPYRIEFQESNHLLYHIQITCAQNSDFSTDSDRPSRESARHPSKIGSSNFRQASANWKSHFTWSKRKKKSRKENQHLAGQINLVDRRTSKTRLNIKDYR
jgi:hypothetical protein